jgi:hypothetical protein
MCDAASPTASTTEDDRFEIDQQPRDAQGRSRSPSKAAGSVGAAEGALVEHHVAVHHADARLCTAWWAAVMRSITNFVAATVHTGCRAAGRRAHRPPPAR